MWRKQRRLWKVTLRFAQGMDPARLKAYQTWIKSWNREHAAIHVQMENTPFASYYQKLQTEVASGSMPDVWLYVAGYGEHWIQNGQALPLDKYIADSSDINMEDYNQSMLKYATYKRHIYGLPYDTAGHVVFYNKRMFDQLNLRYPQDGWTFSDMQRIGKEIASRAKSQSGKVYGVAGIMTGWTCDGYYSAFRTTILNKSGEVGVNVPAGIKCIAYFKNLIDSGISPKPQIGSSAGAAPNTLSSLQGRIAPILDLPRSLLRTHRAVPVDRFPRAAAVLDAWIRIVQRGQRVARMTIDGWLAATAAVGLAEYKLSKE